MVTFAELVVVLNGCPFCEFHVRFAHAYLIFLFLFSAVLVISACDDPASLYMKHEFSTHVVCPESLGGLDSQMWEHVIVETWFPSLSVALHEIRRLYCNNCSVQCFVGGAHDRLISADCDAYILCSEQAYEAITESHVVLKRRMFLLPPVSCGNMEEIFKIHTKLSLRDIPLRPFRPTVCVLTYRPPSLPEHAFEIGFVSAIRELKEYDVTWVNLADYEGKLPSTLHVCHHDIILVKSNWNWVVDSFARRYLQSCASRLALLVSGTAPPPPGEAALFYDALAYETEWYRPQLQATGHRNIVHAFGVDTRPMEQVIYPPLPPSIPPLSIVFTTRSSHFTSLQARQAVAGGQQWDVLFVGLFAAYKRPWLLANKPGRRLAVGKQVGGCEQP